MALDKLVDSAQLDTDLTSVANAIRQKSGASGTLAFPAGFVSAIENIPSGSSAIKNDVTFYDYDGTVVAGYSTSDFAQLSALPANPTHTGLVAQGWNWSLSDAKTYVAKYGKLNIGQMYVTQSGATEIDVIMQEGRLSPILTVCVDGMITVNWGDGTESEMLVGTDLTYRLELPHTYAQAGNYTISISATEDYKYRFYGSSSYTLLRKNTTENENKVYANTVQRIRIGNNAEIGNSAFYNCYSLSSVTIPDSTTSIETGAFTYCYNLSSITIPDGVTSIESSAFYSCYSLTSVTIPDSVTNIGGSAFSYCYSLTDATIPDGMTSINNYMFQNCYSIASVIIPNTVTSITASVFSTCSSLSSVIIPDGVTSIGNKAFQNCYGVKEYHILPTTVPTGGSTMFNNIPSDCIIYVPSASLNTYKTASNWSTYASYMRGE